MVTQQTQNGESVAMEANTVKTVVYALTINATIAASKAVIGILTGSAAMLAEAAHSAVDTSTEVILLAGEAHDKRKAGAKYFWAILAAAVMFTVGGLYALYEGLCALVGESIANDTGAAIGIAVLVGSALMESTSLYRALKTLSTSKIVGVGWIKHIRTSTDTASKTIVAEDSMDILGNVLAIVGITLHMVTGSMVWDALASVAIGVLLIAMSCELGLSNIKLIRTECPS